MGQGVPPGLMQWEKRNIFVVFLQKCLNLVMTIQADEARQLSWAPRRIQCHTEQKKAGAWFLVGGGVGWEVRLEGLGT